MTTLISVKCIECDYERSMKPDNKPIECPSCGGEVLAK